MPQKTPLKSLASEILLLPSNAGLRMKQGFGQVRIIAGDWRGRKLKVLEKPGLRPTPDRVKETLFNVTMEEMISTELLQH